MKNTTNYKEIFAMKKAMMRELEEVLTDIEYRETSLLRDYREIGEVQRTDKDGNLLYFDEDGNKTTEVTDKPAMKSEYEEYMREPIQLDDEDRARFEALQKIKDTILALA